MLGEGKIKAQVADMFRIKYIENKRKMLMMESDMIAQFMANSEGHHDISDTFQEFIESSIKGIAPYLFNGVGNINNFFTDPFYYVLMRNWNNLLSDNDDVRDTITHKLEQNTDKGFNEETEPITIVMQILYKTYLDLYQYVEKKVFYDRNYKEIWDLYFNIGDIIKNVCEKNNQPAKKFFTNFALAINIDDSKKVDVFDDGEIERSVYDFSILKKGDQSETISPVKAPVVEVEGEVLESAVVPDKKGPFNIEYQTNIISHLKSELFKTLAFVGMNGRRLDIVRTDHPEMYFTIGRQFDILSELINGPCRENQEILCKIQDKEFADFNPRDIEILLNICRRNITD